jgi:hypothetical protein
MSKTRNVAGTYNQIFGILRIRIWHLRIGDEAYIGTVANTQELT